MVDAKTAELVLYAITAVGVIVWLAGLRFLVGASAMRKGPPADRFNLTGSEPKNLITGSAEVQGEPAELAAKAASLLARGGVKILEQTQDQVVFEGPASGPVGPRTRQGRLQFASRAHGRTRIDYDVEVSGGEGLLVGGAIFQLLGLIALIVGFWLIRTYVVANPNASVRAQAFQMVQVVHLLWPPFLFGGLYRRGYGAVRAGVDTLVHNLPY